MKKIRKFISLNALIINYYDCSVQQAENHFTWHRFGAISVPYVSKTEIFDTPY